MRNPATEPAPGDVLIRGRTKREVISIGPRAIDIKEIRGNHKEPTTMKVGLNAWRSWAQEADVLVRIRCG